MLTCWLMKGDSGPFLSLLKFHFALSSDVWHNQSIDVLCCLENVSIRSQFHVRAQDKKGSDPFDTRAAGQEVPKRAVVWTLSWTVAQGGARPFHPHKLRSSKAGGICTQWPVPLAWHVFFPWGCSIDMPYTPSFLKFEPEHVWDSPKLTSSLPNCIGHWESICLICFKKLDSHSLD